MPGNSRPPITTGEFYHVYNRGVEKRVIFGDDGDKFRFLHGLYEFNDTKDALNLGYRISRKPERWSRRNRDCVVDIIAFVLMQNHFHMLLRQKQDEGISLFMKKLGTGYTNYFNVRNNRSGALFQGSYKYKEVGDDAYLRYLLDYIHLNPLSIGWNKSSGSRVIAAYAWSSLPAFIGARNNFSILLDRALADELALPGGKSYGKELITSGKERSKDAMERLGPLILE